MMSDPRALYVYFNMNHAIDTHDWIIEHTGGLAGTKSSGQIDSVLEHIQNDDYYPEFEDKLAHLVFSIIKVHAFNDGNKRSSLALGAYFLELNGFGHITQLFVQGLENIVVAVADNLVDKDLFRDIIAALIYEGELSEQVKLALWKAISIESE